MSTDTDSPGDRTMVDFLTLLAFIILGALTTGLVFVIFAGIGYVMMRIQEGE